jgi:hypothetical protein
MAFSGGADGVGQLVGAETLDVKQVARWGEDLRPLWDWVARLQ